MRRSFWKFGYVRWRSKPWWHSGQDYDATPSLYPSSLAFLALHIPSTACRSKPVSPFPKCCWRVWRVLRVPPNDPAGAWPPNDSRCILMKAEASLNGSYCCKINQDGKPIFHSYPGHSLYARNYRRLRCRKKDRLKNTVEFLTYSSLPPQIYRPK